MDITCKIYTFSQHIFQNRAYRLTFFLLFEDTPRRNHPFSSQNERQQQKDTSGAPSFCLDRTQIYMKSEHLTEAKRKGRSRGLPTIINYKDTTTFNNFIRGFGPTSCLERTPLGLFPHKRGGKDIMGMLVLLPHPASRPMWSGHSTSWNSAMKETTHPGPTYLHPQQQACWPLLSPHA